MNTPFGNEVLEQLQYYVYRLVDPRNGETFYIGKGKRNRIFDHIRLDSKLLSEEDNLKETRIRAIQREGMDVILLIHRHGLDESTAFTLESALIDAYPSVLNRIRGHASDDYGLMHIHQIRLRYEAKEAIFQHRLLIIKINGSTVERDSLYETTRYAWRLNKAKAEQADYILSVHQGVIKGVYKAHSWHQVSEGYFPDLPELYANRYGFQGEEAPPEIQDLYVHKRLPKAYLNSHAANPIRYTY